MAVPKFQGIETEYGISVSAAANELSTGDSPLDAYGFDWEACSSLVKAYVTADERARFMERDYHEYGGSEQDAHFADPLAKKLRTSGFEVSWLDDIFANTVLTNGARYYVDHAHPEYASPETTNARDTVVYDRAGDRILETSIAALERATGHEVQIYKNNSDGKDHSYSSHENYLVDRGAVPFERLARYMMPFFVTRQIYTGAGKVGAENGTQPADYQISQRADFIEKEMSLETTQGRPIINTRDEPHADYRLFRRLHVIVGDSNMSEISTYLRQGITPLMLSMIEDGFLPDDFALANPVADMQRVSRDLTCSLPLERANGRSITALELQTEYLSSMKAYAAAEGVDAVTADVLVRFEEVLAKLERDPMTLADQLDWVAKLKLLQHYQDRRRLAATDPTMKMLDVKYHDVRRDKGIYYKLERSGRIGRIVSDAEIDHAVGHPPEDTRAYFRGECVRRYAGQLAFVSWDGLTFFKLQDGGDRKSQQVQTLNPDEGTKAQVGDLLDRSPDAATLLNGLAAAEVNRS